MSFNFLPAECLNITAIAFKTLHYLRVEAHISILIYIYFYLDVSWVSYEMQRISLSKEGLLRGYAIIKIISANHSCNLGGK